MQKLFENWRRYLNEKVEDRDWPWGRDQDWPLHLQRKGEWSPVSKLPPDYAGAPQELVVFTRKSQYKIRGQTHGAISHALKHLFEFNERAVNSLLSETIEIIEHFHEKEKGRAGVYILGIDGDVRLGRDPRLKGMTPIERAKKYPAIIITTLDFINDKIKNGEHLEPVEIEIKNKILPKIRDHYLRIVNQYDDKDESWNLEEENLSIEDIIELLKGGETISFFATYKLGNNVHKQVSVFNSGDMALYAKTRAGVPKTLFKIDSFVDLEAAYRFLHLGEARKIDNANLVAAFEYIIAEKKKDNELEKTGPTVVRRSEEVNFENPEELFKYLKSLLSEKDEKAIIQFLEKHHKLAFESLWEWVLGFWGGQNVLPGGKYPPPFDFLNRLLLSDKSKDWIVQEAYELMMPGEENKKLYYRCFILIAQGKEEEAIELVLRTMRQRVRDIVKKHLGIDICNFLDCELNENKNSNSRIFENWRNFKQEALEEAAQIPRLAQAARPYLNKIGRFLNKAPKWWRSGSSTGGNINIKYGPILNKIMGSNASRMITYLHPNEWWARTIMQVAAKLGPLHSPAFKFMYGTLMTWNAVRAPAVVATGGNWLVDYLTDPKTQEEFDSPNAALAEHLKLMLKEGASEEELIVYLEEVEKVKNLIQPEPGPEPEPMIEPYEKVMP